MKISELTAKPQLVKITLEDDDIKEKYGDVIEFWVWDRQPLEHYFKMAQGGTDVAAVLSIAKEMVLDETGTPVMTNELTLPPDVAMKSFVEVMNRLGK
jgi:hypothetical protein